MGDCNSQIIIVSLQEFFRVTVWVTSSYWHRQHLLPTNLSVFPAPTYFYSFGEGSLFCDLNSLVNLRRGIDFQLVQLCSCEDNSDGFPTLYVPEWKLAVIWLCLKVSSPKLYAMYFCLTPMIYHRLRTWDQFNKWGKNFAYSIHHNNWKLNEWISMWISVYRFCYTCTHNHTHRNITHNQLRTPFCSRKQERYWRLLGSVQKYESQQTGLTLA